VRFGVPYAYAARAAIAEETAAAGDLFGAAAGETSRCIVNFEKNWNLNHATLLDDWLLAFFLHYEKKELQRESYRPRLTLFACFFPNFV
jgi:hypothetical protein